VKVLAIDTTLQASSVAVTAEGKLCAHLTEGMERGHAERLALMTDSAMREAGVAFADLDRIAVTTGPGSFTGVRVGLAFARGLAVALGKPCIGLSTLEVLAREGGDEGVQAAVIALSNTLFLAVYENGARLLAPCAEAPDDAAAALANVLGPRQATLRGPGAAPLAAKVSAIFAYHEVAGADAPALAMLSAACELSASPPAPLYLRAPNLTPPP
jgi:tRNA threonylcarbamoyladenosine biosynthesis protein TsaB